MKVQVYLKAFQDKSTKKENNTLMLKKSETRLTEQSDTTVNELYPPALSRGQATDLSLMSNYLRSNSFNS